MLCNLSVLFTTFSFALLWAIFLDQSPIVFHRYAPVAQHDCSSLTPFPPGNLGMIMDRNGRDFLDKLGTRYNSVVRMTSLFFVCHSQPCFWFHVSGYWPHLEPRSVRLRPTCPASCYGPGSRILRQASVDVRVGLSSGSPAHILYSTTNMTLGPGLLGVHGEVYFILRFGRL